MPMYDYKCRQCGAQHQTYRSFEEGPPPGPQCECGWTFSRDYGGVQINAGRSVTEHFNPSLNQWVRNEQHMQSIYNEKSAEASEYTGIDHKFVVHGPNEAPGVTGDGIDEANSERSRKGLPLLPKPD